MIRVSCSVKTHAFQLAEQLQRKLVLDKLYTIYHSAKDTFTARFNKRRDTENIDLQHIKTFPYLAPLNRFRKDPFANNAVYDSLVARDLERHKEYQSFIGWSGMSIKSILQAKRDGKNILVERGSSHIEFQSALLKDEYARWGFAFQGDKRVVEQEITEYDLADCVVVPSKFVERTFLEKGFPKEKIFRNNFGSNALFRPTKPKRDKFTVLYVGNLSLRKGLPYLFQAVEKLSIDPASYDVWFIGSITEEISKLIPRYEKPNWKFFGHVGHHELADLISQCSVAVHPSLEEGLSMVIPQLMTSGTPVIATTNTGGEDIIENGVSGYIIPIRSPEHIADRINILYQDREFLSAMRNKALAYAEKSGTWEQYGDRYFEFVKSL
jgi:glycosyltransferase involved in cell wall biosynthesis